MCQIVYVLTKILTSKVPHCQASPVQKVGTGRSPAPILLQSSLEVLVCPLVLAFSHSVA